ncbi:coiled-coil domain-containing protein 169-like isoform X2 [Saccostrea echinata]|uniref:coiled-coil domain-containing protein 169-like isoform X2 n=1 Tax=Saccostrea echinata TaxID=191078 RepID=UPI002A8110A8|nr:coiled-coil domain-containing protein 169-like isoform X2 [Saccostrea echinata]
MAVEVMDDFELEKLRAEIQQEKQMKEMLEQSAAELRATVEELEKRYDTIDNEDSKRDRSSASSSDDLDWNEWKTRYETQSEINEQLERQILMLQNKVQEAKANLKDARAHVAGRDSASRSSVASKAISRSSSESQYSKPNTAATQKSTGITINLTISPRPGDLAGKTPRDLKNFDDLSDANKYMVRSLEKEKQMLQGQIRDIEWRLDQESKAYHKANDERKTYSLEINSTKGSINEMASRPKLSSSRDALDTIPGSRTPRSMGSRISLNEMDENSSSPSPRRSKIKTVRNTNYRSLRSLEHEIRNIPEDQRILDPKHGPIKKAAAIKSLPSLETT